MSEDKDCRCHEIPGFRCTSCMEKAEKTSESSVDRLVIPKGVVAVLVADDGREIVDVTDFNHGAPGGMTQQEAQTYRAKRMLAMKTMRELASPLLSNAINDYEAESILRRMCEKDGCKVIIIPVGYDDEEV